MRILALLGALVFASSRALAHKDPNSSLDLPEQTAQWPVGKTASAAVALQTSTPSRTNGIDKSQTPLRSRPGPLYFKGRHGRFKLLILTDTHLLDDQTVPGNASNVSRASTQAAARYLDRERPDFVVHLGDIVSGEMANSTRDVRNAVRQILGPAKDRGIPFATTKGNHDNDLFSTHSWITDVERQFAPRLSHTRKAPRGVGGGVYGSDNYWLPVYEHQPASSELENVRPALLLWFFDSRAGKRRAKNGTSVGIEDWVDASVAPWIKRQTLTMAKRWGQALPPSLVFVHIPPHAHVTTQTKQPYASHVGGIINETIHTHPRKQYVYPGLNDDKPAATQGKENENDTYTGQDRAFLDALWHSPAGQARILALVSGHDHGNDWCAPGSETTVRGQIVPLCYAKHSGFGGYDHKQWNHGARVFDLSLQDLSPYNGAAKGGVKTYIRYLTGEKRYSTFLDDRWAHLVRASPS